VTGVTPTISPSMDIQVSSNFERLLFEAADRDAEAVKSMMSGLKQSGGFSIPDKAIAAIRRQFVAGRTDEAQTAATIKSVKAGSDYLLDPHSAVAVAVARLLVGGAAPVVTLSTAHPAKFPAAVKAAAGIEPALPAWLSDLYEREERFTVLDNDQGEVERFITARTRVLEEQK
jgi:threonine synthase